MIKAISLFLFFVFLTGVTFANGIKEAQVKETRVLTLRELMWKEKLTDDDLVYIRKSLLYKDISSLTFAVTCLVSHQISFEEMPLSEKQLIEEFFRSIDGFKPVDVLEFRSIDASNAKSVVDGVVLIKKIRRGEGVFGNQPSGGIFAMLGKYARIAPEKAVDDMIQSTENLSKFGLLETLYMEVIMTYPGFYEEKVLSLLEDKKRSDFGFLGVLSVGEAKAVISRSFRNRFVDIINKEMGGKSEFVRDQAKLIKGRLKFQDESEMSGESR